MVKITGAYGKLKTWVTSILTTHTAIASAHHTDHQTASTESASFKDVNIAINEAYKQGADIILRIKAFSSFIGIDAGKVATGEKNTFVGYNAGYKNSTGLRNSFIGYKAGYENTTGYYNNFVGIYTGLKNTTGFHNNFIGYGAGWENLTGYHNNFIGYGAGWNNSNGYHNNFIGYEAGYKNTSGSRNSFIGYRTGYETTTGYLNTFLGYKAGYYETGSNKLFIDNQGRANEADARIKALIYGVFNSAIANQLVRLNAILELTSIKNGSTQANAGAAVNEVWKTNGHATLPDNVLMIGV